MYRQACRQLVPTRCQRFRIHGATGVFGAMAIWVSSAGWIGATVMGTTPGRPVGAGALLVGAVD